MRDWARYERALLARRKGATLAEIGVLLGVHKERARQMVIQSIHEMVCGDRLRHCLPLTEGERSVALAHARRVRPDWWPAGFDMELAYKAADEIERLRAEIERLEDRISLLEEPEAS